MISEQIIQKVVDHLLRDLKKSATLKAKNYNNYNNCSNYDN